MTIHKRGENGLPKCGARSYYGARGLVQTTDDDSKVTCKRCLGQCQQRRVRVPIPKSYVGRVFLTTYGYDTTINRYAVCLRQTRWTLVLQECFVHVENDNGRGEGRSWAGARNPDGAVFLVQARQYHSPVKNCDAISFVGNGQYWRLWDGNPNYYNTWD